jgi:MoaA/NifB/PqqE/SkfB family radical SAM enzyme
VREKGVGPKAMNFPPLEAFGQIAEDLKLIQRRSTPRVSSFHIHNLAQLRMVATGKPQYPCVTAGQSVGVIYSNGDVAHCEFTLPFANLAEFGFDFDALWHSDAANARRGQIKACHCTHGCFHGKAVEYSARGLVEMTKSALRG